MVHEWTRAGSRLSGGLLLVAALAAPAFAQTAPAPGAAAERAELEAKLAAQQKELEELKAMIRPAAAADDPQPVSEDQVKKLLEGYLKDHPGAGVPSGVQTGYESGKGFVIRSAPDSKWDNWNDGSKIPFELRIHGRLQMVYEFYKVTDTFNHLTKAAANGGNNSSPDFSQLEVKRGRLFFDGTAFDPNLRFRIDLEGNTRGVNATAGGGVPVGNGANNAGGVPGVPDGAAVALVDHAVRLQGAFIAYDFHPCGYEKGCGPDCPEGTYRYTPTVTAFFGKFKPFMGLEETMLPFSEQFVEWSIASWFFDGDDDAWQMQAGVQVKALDDRFFGEALLTNGNEAGTSANLQLDATPGFNAGCWYDLGGTWNAAKNKYDLFGDCISDIDWSCNPVVRVGGAVNLVPMDRRSEFDVTELSRIRVLPAAPGGTGLAGLLNGGTIAPGGTAVTLTGAPAGAAALLPNGVGQFAVDACDCATYNAFLAGKWHGISLYNDWWVHEENNFRGRRFPTGAYPGNGVDQPILYTTTLPGGAPTSTLFTANQLVDYGFTLQAGYFLVPKKLEVCARWAYIRGDSGNIYGDGNSTLLTTAQKTALGIPSPATTPVRVFSNNFSQSAEVDEYAVGINYFFKRQLLKWQTDFSVYQGGNPAAGGQSAAGFIPGVDGWMVRSQIQFGF